MLQQLQACCPELMLPEHSPTTMPHRPPQGDLSYSECACLRWRRQAPRPTVYFRAVSVPSVSLRHPCCLATLLVNPRVFGGESGDALRKTTKGCKLGQGPQAATPSA